MTGVPAGRAEETIRYRVEVLLLRHLDSAAKPQVESNARNFSDALELRPPGDASGSEGVPEAPAPAEESPQVEIVTDAAGKPLPGDGASDFAPEPPRTVWIEEPGDTMREAWRRLRLSGDFRPELFFAWEQADSEPFPLVRMHDDAVLFEDDPWADLRSPEAALDREPDVVTPGADQPLEQEPPQAGADAATAVPDPIRYYHIDGTVRLRRSRFLHVELDLEWRDPASTIDPGQSPVGPAAAVDAPGIAGPAGPPEAYAVHRVRQSRQIRTGQLEYFDGPYFGVLALVSRIEIPVEEPGRGTEAGGR